MSIIYEALKKIEAQGNKSSEIKIETKPKALPKIYLLYALIICVGFLLANLIFQLFNKPSSIKAVVAKKTEIQEVVKLQPAMPSPPSTPAISPQEQKQINPSMFILNGIFFSGDEGYALINNQIVKAGDFVEGVKVARIDVDEVELESEGSTFKLRAAR